MKNQMCYLAQGFPLLPARLPDWNPVPCHRALMMAAAAMAGLALIPGLPTGPFLFLAVLTAAFLPGCGGDRGDGLTVVTSVLPHAWLVKRIGGDIGPLYERLLHHTHSLVTHLDELYPRYEGQGYELAGLIWFQGENDCFGTFPYYEDLFVDFVHDVRRDLGVSNLPIFIAKINDAWCGEGGEVIRRANEHAVAAAAELRLDHNLARQRPRTGQARWWPWP